MAAIGTILLVFGFFWRACRSTEAGAGASAHIESLSVGDTVTLAERCSGAVSVDAYNRWCAIGTAKDSLGEDSMKRSGEVIILTPGTEVKVLDLHASILNELAQVRVYSGPHAGRSVLIRRGALQGK